MKVLFLSQKYLPSKGGIENSIFYLAKEYLKVQADVTVLTTGYGPELDVLPVNEEIDGITIRRVPWRGFSKFLLAREFVHNSDVFAAEIEKRVYVEAPDLIIARDIFSARAAVHAKLSKKFIYIAPGNIVEQAKYRMYAAKTAVSIEQHLIRLYLKLVMWPMLGAMQKDVLGRALCVVCWSHWLKKNLNNASPKARIKQINPGVNCPKLEIENWKRKYKICSLGRMDPVKNIPLLIESMKYVNQKVVLELTLSGSSTQFIERLIKINGVCDRVEILPETSDVFSRYDNADLFLLPSLYEPFGQTIVEAMSRALPVVALIPSEVVQTASSQIIVDGINGFLVENSPQSFANSINRYYEMSESDAKLMASASQSYAVENYRWIDTAKELAELGLNENEVNAYSSGIVT